MGRFLKTLALSVIVALVITLMIAGSAKSSAPADLNTSPDPALGSLLVKVAEASEITPITPESTTSERLAHWSAVMDALGTKHKTKLLSMIDCESDGIENADIMDTNGKRSRGILMYQDATWAWMSSEAGVSGNAKQGENAIRVADWALSNNLGGHWSCF